MRRSAAGFTLIEAITAMTVLALGMAIGLPSFRYSLERQRLASTMHLVSGQLAMARMAAITHSIPVSVCPAQGNGICTGNWDWTDGWLVYRDPQRQPQPASATHILRQESAPFPRSVTVLSSSGRKAIRFQPDGRSGGSNIKFRICIDGRLRGEVNVNNSGRVRSQRTAGTQPCG